MVRNLQTPFTVIGLKQQTRKLLFTQKGCHPERAQRVEGSTHFVSLSGKFSAKILRLRCAIFIVGLPPAILIMEIRLRYAQDDRVFCCLRSCAKQRFAGLLRKADNLYTNLSIRSISPSKKQSGGHLGVRRRGVFGDYHWVSLAWA